MDGARNMVIPGGSRGFPEATPEQCANSASFTYLVGMPPACASMLVGDQGDAGEKDIDQSPNPNTGRDFNGTEIENLRPAVGSSPNVWWTNSLERTEFSARLQAALTRWGDIVGRYDARWRPSLDLLNQVAA